MICSRCGVLYISSPCVCIRRYQQRQIYYFPQLCNRSMHRCTYIIISAYRRYGVYTCVHAHACHRYDENASNGIYVRAWWTQNTFASGCTILYIYIYIVCFQAMVTPPYFLSYISNERTHVTLFQGISAAPIRIYTIRTYVHTYDRSTAGGYAYCIHHGRACPSSGHCAPSMQAIVQITVLITPCCRCIAKLREST